MEPWQTAILKVLIEEEERERSDPDSRKKISSAFGNLGKCEQ